MQPIIVNVSRDEEAAVYIATSEQVPGLVVEAESFDEIPEILADLLPDLLADATLPAGLDTGRIILRSEQILRLSANAQ